MALPSSQLPIGDTVMKFIVGLLTGLALGAAGAVAYSVTTGRDLREVYAELRSTIDARDSEAPGMRLEARFAEVQSRIEDRVAQVRGQAAPVVSDAAADQAPEVTLEVALEGVAEVTPDATPEGAPEQQPGA